MSATVNPSVYTETQIVDGDDAGFRGSVFGDVLGG